MKHALAIKFDYGPWERNHPSLFDDRVDPENFNLESHNIVPRLQSAIAKTGFRPD